jgi:hypothetical protein
LMFRRCSYARDMSASCPVGHPSAHERALKAPSEGLRVGS